MRVGKIISLPNEYSQFGRIVNEYGNGYSIEAGDMPKGAKSGDEYAYKVEIWSGDSGLAYNLEEED